MQALEGGKEEKEDFFSGGIFNIEEDFNLDGAFGSGSFVDTSMDKLGSNELSMLLSSLLDRPKEELEEEFLSGNTLSISEASSNLRGTNQQTVMQNITEEIDKASTTEEVAKILKDSVDKPRKPLSMLDMRENFVVNSIKIPSNRVSRLSLDIELDAVRSTELAKMQEKVWEGTSLLGILGDFGEIVLPSGVVSEEYDKFTNGLDKALENIRKAPKEKQQEVFNAIVDTWLATETFLIRNNNSILIADQLAGLESAIREGGLGLIESGATTAEFEDNLESIINTTIFAYEFKALGKGLKGLMGFLSYRIFPSNKSRITLEEKIPYTPFTEARNTLVVERPNSARLVQGVQDVRVKLKDLASKKDTTKVRMVLESEKKELGKLKEEVQTTNTNTEARALANKEKIKFKDALKRVNSDKQEQLNAIARRESSVQGMINDFDKAATAESKLSRLNTFEKQGKLSDKDLLEPSDEYKVEMVYDTRTGTTAYDQIAKKHMETFYRDYKEKGLKQLADDIGLSPEAMAARMTPTPSEDTDLGYPNVMEEVNVLLLMDEAAIPAGEKRALVLQRSIGNSLTLQENGVSIVNNTDQKSIGDFKYLFGNGSKGFDSASEAEEAMNNALLGVTKKRVVEKDSKWYIEVEEKHEYNSLYDTKDLYVDLQNTTNKSSGLFDPLRRFGEEILSGISVLKLYNRSTAQKMQDELQDIFTNNVPVLSKLGLAPMAAKDVNNLLTALKHTDKDGVDWIQSVDEFSDIVNMSPDDAQNIWKRYQRIQKIMNDIYEIRNQKFRQSLVLRNVKDVKFGDTLQRAAVVLEPKVKQIYDTVFKKNVNVKDLDPSQVVVRLERAITDETGEYRRLVIANRVDVKELPARVLDSRLGHLDRFYKETGWTVKVKSFKIVDGVREDSSATTAIVKTEKQAQSIAKKQLEETGEEAFVVRARENKELDAIYGDESSVQYGYASAHTKKRGAILKGSDGISDAETLNIIESLARSVGSVEKQLDVDIISNLRKRFLTQFKDYFKEKGGTPYNGRFEEMLDANTTPTEIAEKARQWHNYIESLSTIKSGEGYAIIDKIVKQVLRVGVDSQEISSSLQNFATQMVIVGRPVFQVIQNTAQLIYVAQAYPVEMVHTTYRLIPALLAMSIPTPFNIKMLSKVMGTEEKLTLEFINEMKTNGLWDAVGMSDDFMRQIQRNGVNARSTTAGNIYGVGKNAVMLPFTASKAAQEGVLKLVNLTAYMSEFQKQVIKGGRKFDAKTKKDMSFNTQKITQTQNSVNQFSYQSKSSLLSPMFQFTQHVHKLYLDILVDPVLKLTKDPIMLALKKDVPKRVSPLASGYLQAVGSLISTYMLFGPQGIVGGILGGKIEDEINNIDDPIFKKALQGNMINHIINRSVNAMGFEGQVDYTSKMHPASVVDTFYDYHIEKFAQEGTLSVAGAAGYIVGVVGVAGAAVISMSGTEGLTWEEESINAFQEILGTIAGVSDYQKAYMSYHLGTYIYKSSLSGNLPVTAYESFAQLGNFPPTAVQDRWSEFTSSSAENKDAIEGLSKAFSRIMHRDLAEANTLGEMLIIGSKYSGMAVSSVDPLKRGDMTRALSRYVSPTTGKDYLDYIQPYLDKKDLDDVVEELISLKEDASTDEMRRQIDTQIAIVESMIPAINEAYVD